MIDAGESQSRIYADSSDIVPFWSRLPKFFLYPLHFGAVALILVSMALAYVAQYTFFVFGLLGLIELPSGYRAPTAARDNRAVGGG